MQEGSSALEESLMENVPENGVQQLSEIIVDQRSEEDTPMLHLELEDSEDANTHETNTGQSEEIKQDTEDMVNIKYISFYLIAKLLIFK